MKKAFEEIRQTEVRLGKIVDTIPTLVWCGLPDGSMELFNQRWRDYTGLSPEEAHGWGWRDTIHPDDLEKLVEEWFKFVASGEPGAAEARIRRFDGEYRWFLFRAEPLRDEHGNVVNWCGTYTDIEDWKRAEEKLRQDEMELRQITDAIPQTITVLAPDGTALYVNRVALDETGLTLEEIRADGFLSRAFHPDDVNRVRAERREGLLRGTPFELEMRALQKGGQYRWRLIQYNPVRDEEGRTIRWYATGTDIEGRKQAEEALRSENLALREEIDHSSMFEEIIGSSKPLHTVLRQVAKVAPMDSTVLILGATGTGKELIARAIHKRSNRATRAFIRVNCAAIPPSLLASELFGHEKGAFTGATERRLGRFESANGGTIFLDEIGDLPAETQIALLRVLQEREFERVGSNKPISVDVRLLTATHRDLKAAVAAGTFREDLFYRLNVFPISVPSLRERADDIPLLVEYLVGRASKRTGKKIRQVKQTTMDLFKAYSWPGNIRELQNVVERAVVLCEGDTLSVDESWFKYDPIRPARPAQPAQPAQQAQLESSTETFSESLADREREMIETALRESRGRISGPFGAAKKLGIPRQTLDSKITALGIDKSRFKT